jgi:hypothetical protein
MGIKISINGNTGPEGFLIAPLGAKEFPVAVGLKTDNGSTVNAVLSIVAASGVIVQLSQTNVTITPTQKSVKITAKTPSKKQGDITLLVKVNGTIRARFILTSIPNPRLRFSGRFQARFATDGDFFNEARGTSNGWTWALEGEPDFVPPTNNVPINPGMAVGRVVRFQNAVAPRPHAAPIGVKVTAVEGEIAGKTVSFSKGDPAIGAKVNLGPNSFLASNEPQNPSDPPPFESYGPGFEPMENFELHIGNSFSGLPQSLNDRPKANGFFPLSAAEMTKYGIPALSTFNTQRKTQLLADYHALTPAARTGTIEGRNLATRISHLGGSAADGIPASQGTLPLGWSGKETYNGILNKSILITAGRSAMLNYFKAFQSFRYSGTLLNFHSDELCGQFDGTLTPMTLALMRQIEPVVQG